MILWLLKCQQSLHLRQVSSKQVKFQFWENYHFNPSHQPLLVLAFCPVFSSPAPQVRFIILFFTSSVSPTIPSLPPVLATITVFTTRVLMPQVELVCATRWMPHETMCMLLFGGSSLANTYLWWAVMNWWWRNEEKTFSCLRAGRAHYHNLASPESLRLGSLFVFLNAAAKTATAVTLIPNV